MPCVPKRRRASASLQRSNVSRPPGGLGLSAAAFPHDTVASRPVRPQAATAPLRLAASTSRTGGAPNIWAYSRVNWEMTALGRVGLPDDIGPMIASLLSQDNRWVTAQRIEVSGGQGLTALEGSRRGAPSNERLPTDACRARFGGIGR